MILAAAPDGGTRAPNLETPPLPARAAVPKVPACIWPFTVSSGWMVLWLAARASAPAMVSFRGGRWLEGQAVAEREEVSQGDAEAGHEARAGDHARDREEEQKHPLRDPEARRLQVAGVGHVHHLRRGEDRGPERAGADGGGRAVQGARGRRDARPDKGGGEAGHR